jgi:hypothetical protein
MKSAFKKVIIVKVSTTRAHNFRRQLESKGMLLAAGNASIN